MSLAELLLIFFVAVIAFGPKKLPMLAYHVASFLKLLQRGQLYCAKAWETLLQEQQYQENLKKAKKIE